jgi:hypothetical protein
LMVLNVHLVTAMAREFSPTTEIRWYAIALLFSSIRLVSLQGRFCSKERLNQYPARCSVGGAVLSHTIAILDSSFPAAATATSQMLRLA